MNHYDSLLAHSEISYDQSWPVRGIDFAVLPEHVKEAIRSIDLWKICIERTVRGARWLDKKAPADWRLQMISISNGKVFSRVRLCRNDENPLALAFRENQELKGADGRVTWATVNRKFFNNQTSDYEARGLGFVEKEHRYNDTIISPSVDGYFLDATWAAVLGELTWESQPVAARKSA